MSSSTGHALLLDRCAVIPAMLRDAATRTHAPLPSSVVNAQRWVVTATGASEGPARFFASALRWYASRCAEFVPLSSFAAGEVPRADVLTIFSQELSPNARLALARHAAYRHVVLVTATPDDPAVLAAARSGIVVWSHPPHEEPTLLLRVQGPAAATVSALRLAERVHGVPGSIVSDEVWRAVPDAVDRAFRDTLAVATSMRLTGPVALITLPDGSDAAHGLRWKWLEGVGTCDPPCWDVLQFAHGPWQHVVDRPLTLVALERTHDATHALIDRLASMLDPALHTLIRLRAELPGAASFFEHDARFNALVCAAVPQAGRDLVRWPGQGADAPLYHLGR